MHKNEDKVLSTANVSLLSKTSRKHGCGHPPLLFIGGLHRSGTSMIYRCLGEHPSISALTNTGVVEDEGQHLQDVYPPGKVFGGPGRFGLAAAAHRTEASSIASPVNAERLLEQWKPYWDVSRELLVEKSPPNILQTRLLQALFPQAKFLLVVRHPIPVSLATRKWTTCSLERLFMHWAKCHEIMQEDVKHLRDARILRYEDFVADHRQALSGLFEWLSLPTVEVSVAPDPQVNSRYFEKWRRFKAGTIGRYRAKRIESRWSSAWSQFGYSTAG